MGADFAQIDDVVPLFEKDSVHSSETLDKSSVARISRVKLRSGELWSGILLILQLLVVKAWDCSVSLFDGLLRIKEFSRCGVSQLRIRQCSESKGLLYDSNFISRESNVNRQNRNGINSDKVDGSLSENAAPQTSQSSGSLKDFCTVNYSPERMTKLQHQDPDIAPVVKWLKSDSKRPPRDTVAGYFPAVCEICGYIGTCWN